MRLAQAAEVAVVDLAVCDRCGLCLPLCPPEAIHLELNDLVVDRGACTGCSKRFYFCTFTALAMNDAFLHCIDLDSSANAANQRVSVGAGVACDPGPDFCA